MVTKSVANSVLALRIVALASSAASMALLVTNSYTFQNGAEVRYQDFDSYSLVVAIAAITCAYSIVQLPFAIYHALRHKRLINNGFLPKFDLYADKVISLCLGVACGAGFALSVELKKFLKEHVINLNDFNFKGPYNKLLIRGLISSAFLLVTFFSMAVLSFISSNIPPRKQANPY
ncbi:CASP-like protein 4D1 [Vigna umbellata]|uniref:CASP-like protein 4D1 n=1 Tax=Vigna umbellata TaxID=87088 RepID=UPI001F5EAEC2|nr:CASP-like protein 4D1 [Vigna umbellata]